MVNVRKKGKESKSASGLTLGFFLRSGLFSTWRFWLPRALLIAGLSLGVYWPALHGDWVWDDGWYITTNPLMQGWTGLWKFWFQPGSWVEYYPIQETVQWAQWQLWGSDTLGYHLTNVFLHIVNALLVWRLFSKFGLRLAWLGGLIFAVHPVQVESVAYISELKNTLSLPFFLLSMIAWIDYEESKSTRDYRMALGLFLVAMLCKISMAPFAGVILLYAWWKRGRIGWSDVTACAPFLFVALVLGFMTVWVGNLYEKIGHGQSPATPLGGVLSRIDASGLIASVYFARCFLPVDNLLIYPQWPLHPRSAIEYLPWFVLMGVFYALWRKRRSWGRHALLGLGFFLIILSPFLGLIAVTYMDFTWVMDHFLYIPIIGLIGLVVAGLGDLYTRIPAWTRPFALGGIAMGIALMAWVSHAFAGLFVDEETLWTYILERNPTVWIAHHDLGCDLMDKGHVPEALVHFREVLRLRPDFDEGHYNTGLALEKLGRTDEAEDQYRQALALNPGNAKTYNNLGALLLKSGRVPEAIDLFQRAVQLNPNVAQLHYNLGNTLLQTGQLAPAVEQLTAAVLLDSGVVPAHENLGVALARSGNIAGAIEQFEAALQIDPSYAVARDNLGLALAQTGHIPEAIEQFQMAVEANPNDINARQSLEKLQQYLLDSGSGKQ